MSVLWACWVDSEALLREHDYSLDCCPTMHTALSALLDFNGLSELADLRNMYSRQNA